MNFVQRNGFLYENRQSMKSFSVLELLPFFIMLSCGQPEVGTADVVAVGGRSLRSSSAGATGWRAGCFLLSPSRNLEGQRGC